MADGQFLVDETHGLVSPSLRGTDASLSQAEAASLVQAQANAVLNLIMEVQNPPVSEDLASSARVQPTDTGGTDGPQPLTSDTTNLWLEILPLGTNQFNADPGAMTLILHNTLPDELLEVISSQVITDTNRADWASETFVYGSETTNWTPATVSIGTRTNALFPSARRWSDSGSGIPSWWLLEYGLPTDIDPYALCPSGDGWTIL